MSSGPRFSTRRAAWPIRDRAPERPAPRALEQLAAGARIPKFVSWVLERERLASDEPFKSRRKWSQSPIRVGQWCPIKSLARMAPRGHKCVQERPEPAGVPRLPKVGSARERLRIPKQRCGFLRQFGVEPDPTGRRVTAAPSGFHLPLLEPREWLFLSSRTNALPKAESTPGAAAVPVLKNGFAPCCVCSRRHGHPEPGAANQLNGRTSGFLDYREPIALPEVVVALSLYHLAFGLAILPRVLGLVSLNPSKA